MNVLRKIGYYANQITVEPLAIISFIGYSIYGAIQPETQQYKIQRLYLSDFIQENGLSENWETEKGVNFVQDKLVSWSQALTGINLPVALIFSIIFSALSDKQGRQVNMMLGLTSLNWAIFGTFLLTTNPPSINLPFWVKLVATFVTAAMGDNTLQYMASQAFLADTVPDKTILTIRMNSLSVLRSIGQIIGGLAAASMTTAAVRFGIQYNIAIACSVVGVIWTLLRIPQVPPKIFARHQRKTLSMSVGADVPMTSISSGGTSFAAEDDDEAFDFKRWANNQWHLFYDTWRVFAKKRKGHLRFFIITLTLINFVTALSGIEAVQLVGIYTLRPPLSWDASDLAIWQVIGVAISVVGQFVGMFIFKKLLHWRDTTIITIGFFSNAISTLPIIWATMSWEMELSNVLSCFSGLTSPTIASLCSSLVPLNELGKVYMVFSLVSIVAQIISTYVMQSIYVWSLPFFPGLMWVIVTILAFICVGLMLVMHFMMIREGVGEQLGAMHEDDEEIKERSRAATAISNAIDTQEKMKKT